MTIQKMFQALGTINTITIYFEKKEMDKVHQILEYIEKYINDIDDKFSIFKKSSEINNINKMAGKEFICISEDTFEILKLSKNYGDFTAGLFDITSKPYIDLIKNKKR